MPSKSISAAYSPQEEKTHASTREDTRKLGRVVPKDLVNVWRSQQSTDPKWCPPETDGASVPITSAGAKPGVSLPALVKRSRRGLGARLSYLRQRLSRKQGWQVRDLRGREAQGAENGSPETAVQNRRQARESAKAPQILLKKINSRVDPPKVRYRVPKTF